MYLLIVTKVLNFFAKLLTIESSARFARKRAGDQRKGCIDYVLFEPGWIGHALKSRHGGYHFGKKFFLWEKMTFGWSILPPNVL